MTRRIALVGRALGFAAILGSSSIEHRVLAAPANSLQGLDTDRYDGTIDLNEAKAAASALFDRLDRDHDGTLDRRELKGRLSAKDFATGDPDHDDTLTRGEYLRNRRKAF